jgi:putative Mn2+ efflux pump MntP
VGAWIATFLAELGPWIGFLLLTGLSIYMIRDAIKQRNQPTQKQKIFDIKLLVFLVFATSFDVLSVGMTLGLMQEPILLLNILVLIFTYISAYAGGWTGWQIGAKIGIYKGQLVGALLIFLLGVSLLVQNL